MKFVGCESLCWIEQWHFRGLPIEYWVVPNRLSKPFSLWMNFETELLLFNLIFSWYVLLWSHAQPTCASRQETILLDKVKFLAWANEIVKCCVALSLRAAMNFASWVGYPNSVWVGVSQHVLNFSPNYTSPRKLTWITRLCFLVWELSLGMRLLLLNEVTTNQHSTLNIGIQLINMHICIYTPSICCQQ